MGQETQYEVRRYHPAMPSVEDAMGDVWACEAHPELDWPHDLPLGDECPGPGMPVAERLPGAVYQLHQWFCLIREEYNEYRQHRLGGVKPSLRTTPDTPCRSGCIVERLIPGRT